MTNNKAPRIAIAMEYDGDESPRVTAKGFHESANEILRQANRAGVPIHRDDQLALLLTRLDPGDQIPEGLFVIIAEVLSFAYRLSGKHKSFMDNL
ncbi:MAG: flagellar biosynthesis protein [Gammaproteobacteria bacterium]|jgi:flagellar biosynthesis protein